ncbi:MAG: cation diffusion facilitator family transporter, partial [Chloroflexi bacterium]|nr:cation diffusion facilitator family transporter [Chloroflexota bacterium]
MPAGPGELGAQHGPAHGPVHAHDHDQDPEQDHTHDSAHAHDHDQDGEQNQHHGHEHDHKHDSAHEHDHDQDDGHDHAHDHDHRPDAEHEHRHRHGADVGLWSRIQHLFRPHSHDSADSLDGALVGSDAGIRAVKLSLIGLGLTAALQLAVVIASGSVAVLADTIHNFADASTAIPLWLAFSIGRKPASARYTYGYGRAEDLAGVFVLAMIVASAIIAFWESLQRLLQPAPIQYLGWVAIAGVAGCVGNQLVAQYRIRVGQRIGSAALVADGYHARTDGLTSLAVVVGALGVWLGFPLADPLVGLLITVAILLVLKDAAVQMWRRLMDAVDPRLVAAATAAAHDAPGVQDVSIVRARWIGHTIHAE